MAQVYRFTDENGQVRLMAEIDPSPGGGPAAGTYLPVADAAGVTVDSTTYDNTIDHAGKFTALVFPDDTAALVWAIVGDAFPRLIMPTQASDGIFYVGDGTVDPVASGANMFVSGESFCIFPQAYGPNAIAVTTQFTPAGVLTSGALTTVALVSGTAHQFTTTADVETLTPCTFNPGVATTATVTVALSPDNSTYSTLGVETEPAGTAFDGTIHLVKVRVPAGWYLKLTVNAQATLGLTTYY